MFVCRRIFIFGGIHDLADILASLLLQTQNAVDNEGSPLPRWKYVLCSSWHVLLRSPLQKDLVELCGEQRFTNKSRYENLINLGKPLYIQFGFCRSVSSN